MGLWRRTFFPLLFWRARRDISALRALCRRFDAFASQFKRSANELRAERTDLEGARRGEARESTLIRMQEGRRFFRRRAVCVVLPPFPKSSNAGGIRFLAANPQRDFLRGCPHKFLFCRCG